jgi:hypothetical protein
MLIQYSSSSGSSSGSIGPIRCTVTFATVRLGAGTSMLHTDFHGRAGLCLNEANRRSLRGERCGLRSLAVGNLTRLTIVRLKAVVPRFVPVLHSPATIAVMNRLAGPALRRADRHRCVGHVRRAELHRVRGVHGHLDRDVAPAVDASDARSAPRCRAGSCPKPLSRPRWTARRGQRG